MLFRGAEKETERDLLSGDTLRRVYIASGHDVFLPRSLSFSISRCPPRSIILTRDVRRVDDRARLRVGFRVAPLRVRPVSPPLVSTASRTACRKVAEASAPMHRQFGQLRTWEERSRTNRGAGRALLVTPSVRVGAWDSFWLVVRVCRFSRAAMTKVRRCGMFAVVRRVSMAVERSVLRLSRPRFRPPAKGSCRSLCSLSCRQYPLPGLCSSSSPCYLSCACQLVRDESPSPFCSFLPYFNFISFCFL